MLTVETQLQLLRMIRRRESQGLFFDLGNGLRITEESATALVPIAVKARWAREAGEVPDIGAIPKLDSNEK